MIVVDASVLANVLADDGIDGRRARTELRQAGDVSSPDLVDVETVAVLRKRWLAKTLTAHRFAPAVNDLRALDMQRFPARPFMRRAYELRADVTAYDAVYVTLAEALGCELLTSDAQLTKATGPRCVIRVLWPLLVRRQLSATAPPVFFSPVTRSSATSTTERVRSSESGHRCA